MDNDQAKKVLEAFGRPMLKAKDSDKVLIFARQDITDVKEIEAMPKKELISEYKSLVWLNEIYGQVSLNEMQRIMLMELEIDSRKTISEEDKEKIGNWYEKATKEFEKNQDKY